MRRPKKIYGLSKIQEPLEAIVHFISSNQALGSEVSCRLLGGSGLCNHLLTNEATHAMADKYDWARGVLSQLVPAHVSWYARDHPYRFRFSFELQVIEQVTRKRVHGTGRLAEEGPRIIAKSEDPGAW